MWVVDQDDRVGLFILARLEDGPLSPTRPEFHVVDRVSGDTLFIAPTNDRRFRQAKAHQIPERRRPAKAVLDKFGYA